VIPRDYITEWRAQAPWVQDFQVEQDLVISRALVEIFSSARLRDALAFRGGTALYKLHLKPAARYSEDIGLVQTRAEPAGATMEALREVLDPWLGRPQWKQSEGRVTFVYRFASEDVPSLPLRLKVEIWRKGWRIRQSMLNVSSWRFLRTWRMMATKSAGRSSRRILRRSCATQSSRPTSARCSQPGLPGILRRLHHSSRHV